MCNRAADNSCGLLGALESYNNKIAKTDIRLFPDGGCEQGSGHQQADRLEDSCHDVGHQHWDTVQEEIHLDDAHDGQKYAEVAQRQERKG